MPSRLLLVPRKLQDEPVTGGSGLTFSHKLGGLAERRDHGIDAAVAVEICKRRAAMRLHQGEAGLRGNVLEVRRRHWRRPNSSRW